MAEVDEDGGDGGGDPFFEEASFGEFGDGSGIGDEEDDLTWSVFADRYGNGLTILVLLGAASAGFALATSAMTVAWPASASSPATASCCCAATAPPSSTATWPPSASGRWPCR